MEKDIYYIFKSIRNNINGLFLDRVGSFKQLEIKEAPLVTETVPHMIKDFGGSTDKVINFINVFSKQNINLKLFYSNLIPLNIKSSSIVNIFNYKILGTYNIDKNIIKINRNAKNTTLEHELLHVASSLKKDDLFYSGFSQCSKHTSIGIGLNEGYTQLLTERYFSLKKDADIYVVEKRYAKVIENIVGKELMQDLYFTADLKGLISKLNIYMDFNEILIFLGDLDTIKTIDAQNVFMLEKTLKRMNEFVVRAFVNKIVMSNNFSMYEIKRLIIDEITFDYQYTLYGKTVIIHPLDQEQILTYICEQITECERKQYKKWKKENENS